MKAREKAHQILTKIMHEKAYSHLTLKNELQGISPQDKAFITQIVYGTIQNFMYVRHLYTPYIATPIQRPAIAILLDMSVYQLKFLDRVPDYAIVHEAVDIAKQYGRKTAAFVNGVLQSYLRGPQAIDPAITDPLEQLSITTSHPIWLIKMWAKHYGLEAAENICRINNVPPRHCARVNTLKTSKDALLAAYECTPGLLSDDALYFSQPITTLPAFEQGEIAIQDEGSQLVAIMVDPNPGDRVLDVCAAPGSKSIHMAQRMNNQGSIIAHELHEHRSQLIKDNVDRYGITNITVKTTDSTKSHDLYPPQSFTHVLVDAPCSGFGVLRRKPDIKLLARQDELDGLLLIQKQLLDSVSDLVEIGGVLVYSTCTLNKKENEQQVASFLARYPHYKLVDERTLMPYEYDCDGFYIARMIRESSVL